MGYSDLIIDGGCSDNICAWKGSLPVDPPTLDTFSSPPNSYLYASGIYVCILIIILFGLITLINKDISILKKYKGTLKDISIFTGICIIFQVIAVKVVDITEDYSICYYDSSCFIVNNTLHSTKIWYKLTNKECPDDIQGIFDIFQYYYGNFGNPNTMESSCSESEYGCCYYNNQCSFAMDDKLEYRNYETHLELYNEYVTNNNGYTYSQVWKEDDNGSNCLPIEDIIIKNVYGSDYTHYTTTIYIGIIYFIIAIIMCIRGLYINRGNPRVHFVDLETGPTVSTSDEEDFQLSTSQQKEREEFLNSESARTGRSKGSPQNQKKLRASC
tara:strand:+ start:1894 stop:2877 length:984 start_codon:yes stop_codon:yes gene_type:complete